MGWEWKAVTILYSTDAPWGGASTKVSRGWFNTQGPKVNELNQSRSRSAYNITLQRSLISEPLNQAGHKNYPVGTRHGFAGSIGGNIGSFHHNLIAHAEGRSWSMVRSNTLFSSR